MSPGRHWCRWLGHHHWIAGGITTEADPLEYQHGRKGLRVNMGKTKVLISWQGLNALQKSDKDRCGMCLKGISTYFIFVGVVPVHNKCSGVPGRLKYDASFSCKRCTGQDRPINGKLMTEVTVGQEKLQVVPSFCYLGAAHPQVVVVNSLLLSQDAVSHGANSLSSCPFSPPAHFPSPPEKELTIRVSGVSCSIQAKPGPQPYSTYIACNLMTELWFAECVESPPRTKSALGDDAAWRSGKGTPHPPTYTAWPCRTQRWLVEESPETQSHSKSWPWLPQENLDWNDRHGPPSAGSNLNPPIRQ